MENQQPAWQRHLLLIVGVALPFALMLFVMGYQALIRATVQPPRFAAVYATGAANDYYCCMNLYDFAVNDGQLSVTYKQPKLIKNNSDTSTDDPSRSAIKIYVLRNPDSAPDTYTLTPTTTTPVPEPVPQTLPLPPALQVKMISGVTAPDGYTYVPRGYDYRGGFINELVVGSSGRDNPDRIEKNGRSFEILRDGRPYYSRADMKFIGWIAEPVRP